jgi:hypothetical protein
VIKRFRSQHLFLPSAAHPYRYLVSVLGVQAFLRLVVGRQVSQMMGSSGELIEMEYDGFLESNRSHDWREIRGILEPRTQC